MIDFPMMITDADVCALNWQYFDGSCYKVTSAGISASEARNACLVEDADLVNITSRKENSFVNSLIAGEAKYVCKKGMSNHSFSFFIFL